MRRITHLGRTAPFLLLVGAWLGGRGAVAADGAATLALAQAGATAYAIAVAESATAPERTAAAELAAYLKQITGAEFAMVTPAAAAGRPVIAVGPGAAKAVAPGLGLDKAALGDDGIVLKTVPPHLILSGAEGARRGTLYAVYTFLEDRCGVRWWTQDASLVPRQADLASGALDLTYVPPFRYREALYNRLAEGRKDPAKTRFLVQSRFNGHFNDIPADWGGSYTLIGWCHTFEQLLPPATYFKDHPEWYSELDGKRRAEQSQLCCTNEAMIAELAKNVLAAIARQPEAGIISVAQNDWGGNCQCAPCKALDAAEGSPSGSLLYCVNRVAEVVEQARPGFLVETLAYQYTRKPPKTVRPRANVLVRLSVIERSAGQPIDSAMNQGLMADLQAWKAAAPNLFLWDYTANMTAAFTPHPNLGVFGPDTRTYAASNVRGVFFEGNHYAGDARGDFDELKTYLMAHLLWNPQQDEQRLITDFLNGYYGKAGPILQSYLDLLAARGRDVRLSSWMPGPDAAWLDLDAMNRGTELFDQAQAAVAADPACLARVRRARLQLEHQWLRGYRLYRLAATEKGTPYLGPQDLGAATEEFIARVTAVEGSNLRADGAESLEQFALRLRQRAQAVTNPVLLPAALRGLPRARVIDAQDEDFWLAPGAVNGKDAKASDGTAAKMDPAVLSWSVQFRGIGTQVPVGTWRVYASVRCEKVKDTGVAFTAGIYDEAAKQNRVGLSVRLEDQGQAANVDPNVETKQTVTPVKGAGDGEYHLYDFGVHDLHGQCYVWFGTTGGVSPENVKAVYVDRVIFVKE
jgi:hypothetical protein